jgi:hypothetical protein
MAFIPVPFTVEFEMRMTCDGQKVENTLYYNRNFAPTAAQMLAMATLLANWWASDYADFASTAVQLVEVYATDLTSASGPTVSYVPPTTITGNQTTGCLPNNVSLCVSFRTDSRGRSFRGRNYVTGLVESAVDLSEVQGTVVAVILAAYELLKALGTSTGWTWVVASRFSGVDPITHKPIPRTTGLHTPIQSVVVVDPVVDSQRRRLPKRGQ